MAGMFHKIWNYINHRFFIRYIDNNYWKIVDNDNNKVSTIHAERSLQDIRFFYPGLDLEAEKRQAPDQYHFLIDKATQYLYKVSGAIIDPTYNWVILSGNKVFHYSFPYVDDPWDGKKSRPSLMHYLLRGKTMHIPKGILVKYAWKNYYHFFLDTLPQIYMCDDLGIPFDVPVIVPYDYDKHGYVEAFMKYLPIKRKIIVQQKDQYISVSELYVAKNTFCNDYLPVIKAMVATIDLAVIDATVPSPERIFIVRKKSRGIINGEEIERIAIENGFSIIEPGEYTWIQQMKLFSRATLIIGNHGAGLTNIIFSRRNNVSVLEIMPGGDLLPEHYKNISLKLGYHYFMIQGSGLNSNREFEVQKSVFEHAIKQLIDEV